MTDSTEIIQYATNPRALVEYIEKTGDFERMFEYVNYIVNVASSLDSTLDIVIKGGEELWKDGEHEGESFYDAMVRKTKLSPATIQRHSVVGRMLDAAPDALRGGVEALDFKSKIYLGNAVEQGYQLTDDQWSKAVNSFGYQDVAEVVREVTGSEPRSNWMKFTYDEHGIVWVHTKEGMFELFRFNQDDDPHIAPILERGAKRVVNKLGISPRVRY
jgi:hypothetical protein